MGVIKKKPCSLPYLMTCLAFLAYILTPQATRAGYLEAHDIGLNFPALTLQSCVIWWNTTPQLPLFVWIQDPLECIGFLPQGVCTSETWSYLHQLLSLPPSSPNPLRFPFSKIPLEACLIRTASSPISLVRITIEEQFIVLRAVFLLCVTLPAKE